MDKIKQSAPITIPLSIVSGIVGGVMLATPKDEPRPDIDRQAIFEQCVAESRPLDECQAQMLPMDL